MNAMNLLPVKINRRKQLLSLGIRLAVIQAVILSLIVLTVWLIDSTIGMRAAYITELDKQISAERFVQPEAAAQALRDFHLYQANEMELIYWLELPFFNVKRLSMLKQTLPEGVSLLQATLDEGGAVLTLLTENISLADVHREAWIYTGLVETAQMTSMIGLGDGMLRYVLTLRWLYED